MKYHANRKFAGYVKSDRPKSTYPSRFNSVRTITAESDLHNFEYTQRTHITEETSRHLVLCLEPELHRLHIQNVRRPLIAVVV